MVVLANEDNLVKPQPQEEVHRPNEASLSQEEERAATQQEIKQLRKSSAQLKRTLARLKKANTQVAGFNKTLQDLQRERAQLQKENDHLRKRNVYLEGIQDERAELCQELGGIYTQLKLFDRAIEVYERALQFNSPNAMPHYYLGLLYEHTRKDTRKALYHLKEYLRQNPQADNREEVEYLIKMLKEG